MKKITKSFSVLLFVTLALVSCDNESSEGGGLSSIPSDDLAGAPPTITTNNVAKNIPNPLISRSEIETSVVTMQMTGIKEAESGAYIPMLGTEEQGQTCWLQVDGENKGILIKTNNEIATKSTKEEGNLMADVVFVVDNSGSMEEESDTIASHIAEWARYLEDEGLNVNVGVVGYDGDITGAQNLSGIDDLTYYLLGRTTRWGNQLSGVDRTVGFAGVDSLQMLEKSEEFNDLYGTYNKENGILAIRYADQYFSWRSKANRIYVNFTDEPNQPDYNSEISVNFINDEWAVNQGTIHTVYSEEDTVEYWKDLRYERPWLASEYTGGSVLFINSYASDLELTMMPVTEALTESFTIEFKMTPTAEITSHGISIFIDNPETGSNGQKTFEDVEF